MPSSKSRIERRRVLHQQSAKEDNEKYKKIKENLEKISHSVNDQPISNKELQECLLGCSKLKAQDMKVMDAFLRTIFQNGVNRLALLQFLKLHPKKMELKRKIISQWMLFPQYVLELGNEDVVMFLSLFKSFRYVPEKAEPVGKGNFDVMFCARVLQELEKGKIGRESLSQIAYTTFLLGSALELPRKQVSEDVTSTMRAFIPFARQEGLCDGSGAFYTQKIEPSETIHRAMIHPQISITANFFKILFLITHANKNVLPRILQNLQDNFSMKEFETNLKQYYSHLSRVFIPNLFNMLNNSSTRIELKVIQQLSKFLLEFPVDFHPQTVNFVSNLTRTVYLQLNTFTLSEIFEVLKLNNFFEIRHKIILPPKDIKESILDHLVIHKHALEKSQIEMLMEMKFTLFKNCQEKMDHFEANFKMCHSQKKKQFESQLGLHYCESAFYKFLANELNSSSAACLKFSHICERTGKEIDIAFIRGTLKIAIHVDGKHYHYYLDREEQNRKTLTRNETLRNAGWVNVCQPLPDSLNNKVLSHQKESLLAKLKLLLSPTDFKLSKLSQDASLSVTHSLATINNDISVEQTNQLLTIRDIPFSDALLFHGFRNRALALQKLLHERYSSHAKISHIITLYELPHSESPTFALIPNANARIKKLYDQVSVEMASEYYNNLEEKRGKNMSATGHISSESKQSFDLTPAASPEIFFGWQRPTVAASVVTDNSSTVTSPETAMPSASTQLTFPLSFEWGQSEASTSAANSASTDIVFGWKRPEI